jgi:predicted NAD/FAD-binding protein
VAERLVFFLAIDACFRYLDSHVVQLQVARLLAAEAAKVHLNARVVGVRHNHCDASNAGATAAASAGPNEASSNAVKTTAAKPEVVTVDTLGVESSEAFDHVVVVTQAHQALKLLRQPPTKLAHALGSFK